jgi:hypothetical protein
LLLASRSTRIMLLAACRYTILLRQTLKEGIARESTVLKPHVDFSLYYSCAIKLNSTDNAFKAFQY